MSFSAKHDIFIGEDNMLFSNVKRSLLLRLRIKVAAFEAPLTLAPLSKIEKHLPLLFSFQLLLHLVKCLVFASFLSFAIERFSCSLYCIGHNKHGEKRGLFCLTILFPKAGFFSK